MGLMDKMYEDGKFAAKERKKKNEEELGEIFTFLVLETILLSQLMNINPLN